MKNSNAPSEVEPTTFQLVVQCLNQLYHHMPLSLHITFHVSHAVYGCYIYVTGTIHVLETAYFTLKEDSDASNSNAYSCTISY